MTKKKNIVFLIIKYLSLREFNYSTKFFVYTNLILRKIVTRERVGSYVYKILLYLECTEQFYLTR